MCENENENVLWQLNYYHLNSLLAELFQAVEELNIKTKNWKDLLTDEPFLRKDIIEVQDPKDYSKFNLNTFHHLKNNLKVEDEGEI